MPKKLLMISTDRRIFDATSAVRARQIEYARDWDEVHIIVFATKKIAGEMNIAPNVWVYSTRSRTKFFYPFDAIRLGRFIITRRGITDITCQDFSFTAMAGVSLAKEFKTVLEIQVHGDIGSPNFGYTLGNRLRKALALKYLPAADHIRVVSNRIKEYLVSSLSIAAEKIEVRPIAVSVDWIKNSPVTVDLHKKYPDYSPVILMASRLEKEKNIELAIEALKEVVKSYPKAGLIIVGDGTREKKIITKAQKMSLTDRVKIEPWADQTTLASYYKTADLFLNTSLFEGYGMTLVEAVAANCPVVSTDVGVAAELGAVITSFDPEDVSQKIIEILRKNNQRNNNL